MKVTNREKIGNSKAGPLISYEFELDTQIQAESIRTIVETIIKSGLVSFISLICIAGEDYSLRFDTAEELFDYIEKNNIDDATHYIQETMRGLQILGFGFELWTNRMNLSVRLHDEAEVLRLVERIEAALLAG